MNKPVKKIITKIKNTTSNIKESVMPFNFIFPSLITVSSLCFGITAIRFAILGLWEKAIFCILISAVLDLFDGRVARILGVSSTFGAELDSLSDAVCFGIAPAITIYLWGLEGQPLGWTSALFFAVCGVLRLARFNTMLYEEKKKPVAAKHSDYFTGIPIPAGAFLGLIPIVLDSKIRELFGVELSGQAVATMSIAFLVVVGILMVSTIPTLSTKKMHINKDSLVPLLAVIGIFTAFLITQLWLTYLLLGIIYLMTVPFTWYRATHSAA
jgi:CDP-diacylglycerol--serine O-phosphatidyltransferase